MLLYIASNIIYVLGINNYKIPFHNLCKTIAGMCKTGRLWEITEFGNGTMPVEFRGISVC